MSVFRRFTPHFHKQKRVSVMNILNRIFLHRLLPVLVLVSSHPYAAMSLTSIRQLNTGLEVCTPYGKCVETEPVLIELMLSNPFQRLRYIHQYGPSHYVKKHVVYAGFFQKCPTIDYTRYDHSLCIWMLTKIKNRPLNEQITVLLHDISHTALSHLADFLYTKENTSDKSYQDHTLKDFLIEHGIADILQRYSISVDDVLDKPYLDRIDYTLTGGYLAGVISLKAVHQIIADLTYDTNTKKWYFADAQSAALLVDAFLVLTRQNTGALWNTIVYECVGRALQRAMELGLIDRETFEYAVTDDQVWDIFFRTNDAIIRNYLFLAYHHEFHIARMNEIAQKSEPVLVVPKFRELQVWVPYQNKLVSILDMDIELRSRYYETEASVKSGWIFKSNMFGAQSRVLLGH